MTNKKVVSLNLIAGLLTLFINLLISFFLAPFIIEKIGTEAYGFISLANNFVNYATILTIALNSMAGRYITIAIHKNKEKEANQYFNSIFFANVFIIVLLIIPSIGLIFYLDKILEIPANLIIDVKILFSLIFLNFFVNILDATFAVSTFATNKLHLHSIRNLEGILIKSGILITVFSILVPHVFYVGMATLVSTIFLFITDVFYTKKLLPIIKIKRAYFSFRKVIELIKSGIWNTVTHLGNLISGQLDLIICNLLISPLAMGQLAIAKTINTVLDSLINTVSGIFMPELTICYAKEDKAQFLEKLKLSMKTTGFFSNIPFCFIIIYGQDFFKLWTPSQDAHLLAILTILTIQSVILAGVINPLYYVYTITNKIKIDAICRVILGIFEIIIMYLIIKYTQYGIYAAAGIGAFVGTVFNIFFVPVYTAKYCLNIKWWSLYPLIFRYVGTTFLYIIISMLLKNSILVTDWFTLIINAVIVSLLGIVINYIILLNRRERHSLKEMVINRVFNRK